MVQTAKLRKIGNSVGVILPKEVLTRMRLEEGDDVFLREIPEGVVLSAYDEEVEAAMKDFDAIRKRYRKVFRALAR